MTAVILWKSKVLVKVFLKDTAPENPEENLDGRNGIEDAGSAGTNSLTLAVGR